MVSHLPGPSPTSPELVKKEKHEQLEVKVHGVSSHVIAAFLMAASIISKDPALRPFLYIAQTMSFTVIILAYTLEFKKKKVYPKNLKEYPR